MATTPRATDPAVKDVPPDVTDPATADNTTVAPDEVDDTTEMIVYREPFVNADGVQDFREHRVALADWPAYEREHGL